MTTLNYDVIQQPGAAPIKLWTRGVPLEDQARQQLQNIAKLPFIHKWISVMPDVHLGKGATVGSVVPTIGAIIPAAVGVDIGCGMVAARLSLTAQQGAWRTPGPSGSGSLAARLPRRLLRHHPRPHPIWPASPDCSAAAAWWQPLRWSISSPCAITSAPA